MTELAIPPTLIRDWRLRHALTQDQAAELMGIATVTWTLYEKRGCPLNFWRAVRYAEEVEGIDCQGTGRKG